jgi:hypothetical protein
MLPSPTCVTSLASLYLSFLSRLSKPKPHLANVGSMIEDMEIDMR